MRYGFKTSPQHTAWSDMLDVWRAADDIDVFESAWNFDHFYPIFSDSTGPCLEGWTMLAAMAQAIDIFSRHLVELEQRFAETNEIGCGFHVPTRRPARASRMRRAR